MNVQLLQRTGAFSNVCEGRIGCLLAGAGMRKADA